MKTSQTFSRNDPQHAINVSKEARIRNRYNPVPHLAQDTNGKVTNTLSIKHHTNESQEVSPFPAGDTNAAMNRQESMTNTKHK